MKWPSSLLHTNVGCFKYTKRAGGRRTEVIRNRSQALKPHSVNNRPGQYPGVNWRLGLGTEINWRHCLWCTYLTHHFAGRRTTFRWLDSEPNTPKIYSAYIFLASWDAIESGLVSESVTLRTELTDVTLVSEDTYWRLYWWDSGN